VGRNTGRNTRNPIGRAAAHSRNAAGLSKPHGMEGTPTMCSDDAALERSGRPRFLDAAVAGLGVLFAAALFLGLFDHGLPPKPARAVAAPVAAAPSAPVLCFDGPGGELLDFAPAARGPLGAAPPGGGGWRADACSTSLTETGIAGDGP
jgi:hypothetical protein